MSTSLIQFKRSETPGRMEEGGRVLEYGEPAVDFDAGIFYIGDGTTSPGLPFASTDSTASIHQIASTTSIGSTHTINATKLGQVLRATGESSARMERLGFYDLGPITDIDSGSDIVLTGADATGMPGRWHWMTTHTAPKNSLFFTDSSSYSNVGLGTGDGTGNMEHSGEAGSSSSVAYQVRNLSYDITALPDTTGGVMALVAKKSGSNNVLQFKRIGGEDLTGGSPVHDMTSASHTGPTNSIFYTGATSAVLRLSYAADETGSVLKKTGTNTLAFGKLAFADITGNVRFTGQYAEEGFTLRYDIENARWESNNSLRVLRTSTYSGAFISNAGNINQPSIAGASPYLLLKNYASDDTTTALEIMIPNVYDSTSGEIGQGTLNSYASGKVTFATTKGEGGNNDMLFYTASSRSSDLEPNIWMRFDGALWVRPIDLETTTTSTTAAGNPTEGIIRSLYVYPRTTRRSGSAPAQYAGWAGLEIGEFKHYQHINSTPNTSGINGIYLNTITSNNGIPSVSAASHHNVHFIQAEDLTSPASSYGILIGNVTAGTKSSSVAKGLTLNNISATSSNGEAMGLSIGSISSYKAYGASIKNVLGTNEAYGWYSTTISCSAGETNGIEIENIFSSIRARGISYPSITSDSLATGIYLQNVKGDNKTVGLFIGINNSGLSEVYDSVIPLNEHYAIYTVGGKHAFGGDVDITGDLKVVGDFTSSGDYYEINAETRITLDGPVRVDTGRRVEVFGVTTDTGDIGKPATPSMQINNGHLLMVNGVVMQPLREKTITAGMTGWDGHAQDINATEGFLTNEEVKTTSVVRVYFNDLINKTLYRIGKGFDGQVITFINNSTSRDLAFAVNYSSGNVCDIGGVTNSYYYLKPYNAISFICNHDTDRIGGLYGNTNYKWSPINYDI